MTRFHNHGPTCVRTFPMPAYSLFVVSLILVPLTLIADDWPHWRGLKRNGTSAEKNWRSEWPETGPPVLWKAAVGRGFSALSVANGRTYTMGYENGQDSVSCLDATTGRELW